MWLEYSLCSNNCFFLTPGYFLRALDNSNLLRFPLKVRVIGSRLYLKLQLQRTEMNFEKVWGRTVLRDPNYWIRFLNPASQLAIRAFTCISYFCGNISSSFQLFTRYLLYVLIILDISSRWMNLTELHDKATIILVECGSFKLVFFLSSNRRRIHWKFFEEIWTLRNPFGDCHYSRHCHFLCIRGKRRSRGSSSWVSSLSLGSFYKTFLIDTRQPEVRRFERTCTKMRGKPVPTIAKCLLPVDQPPSRMSFSYLIIAYFEGKGSWFKFGLKISDLCN